MTDWSDLTEDAEAGLGVEAEEALRKAAVTERLEGEVSMDDRLDEIAVTIDRLDHIRGMAKALKKDIEEVEGRLCRLVAGAAPTANTQIVSHKGRIVQIDHTEKWKWDKAGLEAEYGSAEELPDYISRSFTVRKPVFMGLPSDQQDELRRFLEIEAGKPKVEVRVEPGAPEIKTSDFPF